MKRQSITLLFAPVLLSILLHASPAFAGNDVEEQLKTNYIDKVLTLRHFYQGDRLAFQFDGTLNGVATLGPWTVDGQIAVTKIKLHDHALQIHGRRVFLAYDAKASEFRDVLTFLDKSKFQGSDKSEKFFRSQEVEIEIALPSEKPDLIEASTAMNAVFLTPGESMAAVVPSFWRDYFDQKEGRPRTLPQFDLALRAPKPGVSMPRATYSPDPSYSDPARRAKYQGTMMVSLVADASGTARDIQIVTPLGLGLDENAVESVSHWKFDPARKDDAPVSAQLMVEVSFHLY